MIPRSMKLSMQRGASLPRGGSITSSLSRGVSEGGRAGVVKDPRPTSDRGFQKAATERIYQWLFSHNYDLQKSAKALSGPIMSPSQSDFFGMVEFIYTRVWSPNFRLAAYAGDQAEGVLSVFRCLRYPYALSKSNLASVAPHNIGNILGALVWLVELADVDEEAGMGPTTTKRKDEEETVDQLWMNYLAESFKVAGKPTAVARLDNEFREQLRQQLAIMAEAAGELERQSTELKHDLAEEEAKAQEAAKTASELERRISAINADVPKLDQLVVQFGQRNAELEAAVASKQHEAASSVAQLEAALQEKAQLEEAVAQQGLSPADRELAITERAMLQRHLEETKLAKEQRSREVSEVEMFIQRKIGEIERCVQTYQGSLVRLSLLRDEPRLVLTLATTTTPASEEQLLEQIRRVARPALKARIAAIEVDIRSVVDEQLAKEERLARLKERFAELEGQCERADLDVHSAEKHAAELKEKCDAEMRQQQALLHRLRGDGAATKEQAIEELNAARAANVSEEARALQERERHRTERLQWEVALMELNRALVEHKAAVHQSLEALALESRRVAESAQQEQPPSPTTTTATQRTPSSVKRRIATPGRPSLRT